MPTVYHYYLFTQIYIPMVAVSSMTKTKLSINQDQKRQWSTVVYEGSLIVVICHLVDSHIYITLPQ